MHRTRRGHGGTAAAFPEQAPGDKGTRPAHGHEDVAPQRVKVAGDGGPRVVRENRNDTAGRAGVNVHTVVTAANGNPRPGI